MQIRRTSSASRARLDALIEQSKHMTLRVGFLESAKYANGMPVASVAAIQEFGAPSRGIPPRPFMRPTATAKKADWSALFARGARAAIVGTIDLRSVFEQVGGVAAGDIARTISKIQAPPLSPKTILARQYSYASGQQRVGNLTKPLVFSGILFNSVTHEVRDES